MNQTFPMTRQGFDRLEAELKNLKNIERPNVLKAIAEARQHGDLSENAEYHAAKEKQGIIEARINYIQSRVNAATIVDIAKLSGDRILFGAKVNLTDEETNEKRSFQIVGSDEANAEEGLLSITSPLAKKLLGKQVGDSVDVTTPGGHVSYTINSVSFNQ